MSDSHKMMASAGLGVFVLYWLFATVVRSAFGVDVPDPGALFPAGWRPQF